MPVVDLGYEPRPFQQAAHEASRRFTVLVAHRRFGKTVWAVRDAVDRLLRCNLPEPRVAYCAPFRNQAKRIAWFYLRAFTANIPGRKIDKSDLTIGLPGDRLFSVLGTENPDALRGGYFDHIVLDEFAQMAAELMGEVVLPALADRLGSATILGTPKGTNAFHDWAMRGLSGVDPEIVTLIYKASETGVIDPRELERLRTLMSEAEYEQEFECSFLAAIAGAYYARELDRALADGRICEVPVDTSQQVFTCWDLGLSDATSIWFFQVIGTQVRWIDFYQNDGVGLDHYAQILKAKPYTYGKHFLPHDIAVRELGNGQSRLATLEGLGIRPIDVGEAAPVEDGINAARNLINRSVFDATRCADGIDAMRHYRREWSGKLRVWRARPVHDWASHPADAFRTGAMGLPRSGRSITGRRGAFVAQSDFSNL